MYLGQSTPNRGFPSTLLLTRSPLTLHMALVIRAELFQPGMQIVQPEFYNQMITLHGLIMIFGGVMPAFVGLANWLVPMMIGAPDMALPRMNNLSFWILPFAFFILLSSLFMEGGAPNFGWTFYAPLSTTYAPPSVTFFIFSVHITQRAGADGFAVVAAGCSRDGRGRSASPLRRVLATRYHH